LQPDTARTAPAFRRDLYAERLAEAHVPKHRSIYDLVKEAAQRLRLPRSDLLQEAIDALRAKELPAANLSELINPKVNPTMTYGGWLECYRGSDPESSKNFFTRIIVRKSDFEKWLGVKKKTRERGPEHGTTGFRVSDENVVGQMRKLIRRGLATSPNSAASMLVAQIRGGGTQVSKQKRLIARYYEKYPKHR
jgi:hypothetical protein